MDPCVRHLVVGVLETSPGGAHVDQSLATAVFTRSWCFTPLVICANSFLGPTHVLTYVSVHLSHYDV